MWNIFESEAELPNSIINEDDMTNIPNVIRRINKKKPGFLKHLIIKLKEKEKEEETQKYIRENKFAYKVELEKLLKNRMPEKTKKFFDFLALEKLEKAFENDEVGKLITEGKVGVNQFYIKSIKEIINKSKDVETYRMKI